MTTKTLQIIFLHSHSIQFVNQQSQRLVRSFGSLFYHRSSPRTCSTVGNTFPMSYPHKRMTRPWRDWRRNQGWETGRSFHLPRKWKWRQEKESSCKCYLLFPDCNLSTCPAYSSIFCHTNFLHRYKEFQKATRTPSPLFLVHFSSMWTKRSKPKLSTFYELAAAKNNSPRI